LLYRLVFVKHLLVDTLPDECVYGISVGLCTHYQHLIAQLEHGVTVWNRHLSVVKDARTNHIAPQELGYLQQRSACYMGIVNPHHHLEWLVVRVASLLFFQLFLLIAEVHTANHPHNNYCSDDAKHSKGVSTGITRGYLWHIVGENRA